MVVQVSFVPRDVYWRLTFVQIEYELYANLLVNKNISHRAAHLDDPSLLHSCFRVSGGTKSKFCLIIKVSASLLSTAMSSASIESCKTLSCTNISKLT